MAIAVNKAVINKTTKVPISGRRNIPSAVPPPNPRDRRQPPPPPNNPGSRGGGPPSPPLSYSAGRGGGPAGPLRTPSAGRGQAFAVIIGITPPVPKRTRIPPTLESEIQLCNIVGIGNPVYLAGGVQLARPQCRNCLYDRYGQDPSVAIALRLYVYDLFMGDFEKCRDGIIDQNDLYEGMDLIDIRRKFEDLINDIPIRFDEE
ncbi:hypothetical protein QBC45DRAFT_437418 [Copromyces sp. CBS 386.78]|nr:hypothetical protein QBC45DRAFT_437418 [Copromyces sp. CBS 386.78]